MRGIDPVLRSFLEARDETAADTRLGKLLIEVADPVICRVIGSKFRVRLPLSGSSARDTQSLDAEDTCSEAHGQLARRLHALRNEMLDGNGDGAEAKAPIKDFRSYAATVAFSAWNDYLRDKRPARARLLNQVRYLLDGNGRHTGLGIWDDKDGGRLCGFSAWKGRADPSARIAEMLRDPAAFIADAVPLGELRRVNPAKLLAVIFDRLGAPVPIEDLLEAVAELWDIHDEPPSEPPPGGNDGSVESPGDFSPDPCDEVRWAEYLSWLWRAVGGLSGRQKAAFLLNSEVIREFEFTGIASIRTVANALGLTAEEVASFWDDLPLSDNAIADRLNATRQQVINLRKGARIILGRQLAVLLAEPLSHPFWGRHIKFFPDGDIMNTDSHIDPEEAREFCELSPSVTRISPEIRLRMSDHASRCPACQALLRSVSKSHSPNERARTIDDIRSMATAARGTAEREQEDLRVFASHLQSFPEEQFVPGGTLPAPEKVIAERGRSAPSRELRSWWQSLLLQSTPWAVAGVAITVAAVLGVSSFTRHGSTGIGTAVLLQDGPIVVTADGTLRGVTSLPDDLRTALVEIVRQHRFSLPSTRLGNMRGNTADSRVASPSFSRSVPPQPLEPPAGSVVETPRPTLRWTAVPGAMGYTVEVSSFSSDEVIASGPLPLLTTAWCPGAALNRGTIYRWTVRADTKSEEGQTTASATMKVLGAADEEEIQRLRLASQGSHLVMAAVYHRLNLSRETKAELYLLQAANPDSSLAKDMADSLP